MDTVYSYPIPGSNIFSTLVWRPHTAKKNQKLNTEKVRGWPDNRSEQTLKMSGLLYINTYKKYNINNKK